MFEIIKSDVAVPFEKIWTPAALVSALLVLLSIVLVFTKIFITKDFNWGTDFAGGTEMQVGFVAKPEIAGIRDVLSKAGFGDASVTSFGGENSQDVLIRISQTSEKGESLSSKILSALQLKFGAEHVTLQRLDEVGPKVGRDLKINGIISVLLAIVGIFAYVWFRFTPEFAPGAILALVHDVMVSFGAVALFNLEFELSTLAALLTILGYSINDTMVIYDRIRDRLKQAKRGNYTEVVIKSLNETLSRTILTSVLTFFVVLALFIYTQGEIRDFAFVLMIGIIAGSYSTIFIATPTLVWLEKWKKA